MVKVDRHYTWNVSKWVNFVLPTQLTGKMSITYVFLTKVGWDGKEFNFNEKTTVLDNR